MWAQLFHLARNFWTSQYYFAQFDYLIYERSYCELREVVPGYTLINGFVKSPNMALTERKEIISFGIDDIFKN